MILEDVERPNIEKYYLDCIHKIPTDETFIIYKLCEYIKLLEEELDENGWRNK